MSSTTLKAIEVNENRIAIAAAIIPFSIAGVLIRLALQRLETFPGAPVFALVYAQWIGCFIMGMAGKLKSPISLWYQPCHPGITTGLCGSITTFSSWQLGIFQEFANFNAYPHTRGKNILAAISEFVVTLAMSLNGLKFGQHVGEWLTGILNSHPTRCFGRQEENKMMSEEKIVPKGWSVRSLTRKDYCTILFGIACWIGVILAAIFTENQKELALACVFAPVGALLRWMLSFVNKKNVTFPLGTYIANIFGTAVLAALILSRSGPQLTPISCNVVEALGDGFCGCLTTISTFMVELTTLPRRHSYIYGILSVVVGQCFMFVILGTYIWTNGARSSC
ncbi:CrcB-like protein-domain-containing protein [Mycotypha africana]|uniref:CrcB-like protein-domain-containing protein n=1 Tax=Mycotypha africana TaxID=64632 RepID=UPI0023011771|nr:CrcB-like protein-domain-containing protein [Mycotypha africana]KAI8969968.1 CrcB-like protein-domain-containing protein [Mycotypha africana]